MANPLLELVRAQVGGKAITPHPALETSRGGPVGVTDLNLGRVAGLNPNSGMTPGGPRLKQHSAERHLEGYGGPQAMDWVMDCVRYIADTVATADYHFEKPDSQDAESMEPGEHAEPPAALKMLMESPNPYMDYIEMIEVLVQDLLLVGNAYWFKWRTNDKGQPLALYRLAPPYVEVETDRWGIANYLYQIPNAEKLEIEPANVIHFKLGNPDPANPFYGVGLISGAGRAADLEIALTDSQASYFENHAMPSMTLESARRVPKDVFRKIKQQLRARAQGPGRAGELLVLEAGLSLNSVAPNALEAAFLELSKMSRNRVFSWFRINPRLLGIVDEASGADKITELQRQFDLKTAKPLMKKLEAKLSKELVQGWDLDYRIDYEYQLSPEERAHIGQVFGQMPGLKVNELRKAAGYPPLTGADKDIGEMVLNLPGEEGGKGGPGEVPTENGFPDRGLSGEPGRPPNAANTKAFPKNPANLPAGAKVKASGKAVTLTALPSARSLDDILAKIDALPEGKAEAPGTPMEDTLHPRRVAEVDEATDFMQNELRTAAQQLAGNLIADLGEGKAFDANDIIKKLKSSAAWATFAKAAEQAYEQGLSKVMSAASIHHSDVGIVPKDEVDYEGPINKIVSSKETGVKTIIDTFKSQLADALKAAKGADATPEDIEKALSDAISAWEVGQAKTVALTTATHGYNEATLNLAEAAGIDKVLVSDGTDSDAPCVEANGNTWDISKARENILEHPNCRRAFVPVVS